MMNKPMVIVGMVEMASSAFPFPFTIDRIHPEMPSIDGMRPERMTIVERIGTDMFRRTVATSVFRHAVAIHGNPRFVK